MRYTLVTPLRSKEAEGEVTYQWGPEVILSNQGIEFRNHVMKGLAEPGEFQHKTATIYQPASNGSE